MKSSKATLLAAFDESCGRALAEEGFHQIDVGVYERTVPDGTDCVLIDPRSVGRYCIMVSFYPPDLDFLQSLEGDEPRGFPVGPYLGQQSISSREYLWPARSLENGAELPCQALKKYALPWLQRLRDKEYYASQVDQRAVLYAAAACERAGMIEEARRYYQIMLERLRMALANYKTEREFARIAGRTYVLVARKLSLDLDIASRLEGELNAKIVVEPLPSHIPGHP
jgi:hypothetical protein